MARQFVVERLRVGGEKALAMLAGGAEDKVRRSGLGAAALRLARQAGNEIVAFFPEMRIAAAIVSEVQTVARRGGEPVGNGFLVKAGRF